MAGAEGFEPPKAVLETAGLPLAYAPTRAASTPSLLETSLLDFSLLLNFPVGPMATAKGAKLLQLQPLGLGLLVLGLAVILPFALGALQSDNLSHIRSCSVARRIQNPEVRIQNARVTARSLFWILNSRILNSTQGSPSPFPRPPSGHLRGSRTAIPCP